MLRDWGRGNIDVIFNGALRGMSPGTRIEFPDSRGQCIIIYLRTESDGRAAFAIRCSPVSPQ
jgi:hypothetical protein